MNELEKRFFALIGIPDSEIESMKEWKELTIENDTKDEFFHTEAEF